MIVITRVLLVACLILQCIATTEEWTPKTLEELKKMPIKQLRKMIEERDVGCKGCTEKDEYVNLVMETQHLPIKDKSKPAPVEDQRQRDPKDFTSEEIQRELDELTSKMNLQGMGGAKLFSAKDFEGLSPEEMKSKLSGGINEGLKRKADSSKKKDKKKKQAEPAKKKSKFNLVDDDKVEL